MCDEFYAFRPSFMFAISLLVGVVVPRVSGDLPALLRSFISEECTDDVEWWLTTLPMHGREMLPIYVMSKDDFFALVVPVLDEALPSMEQFPKHSACLAQRRAIWNESFAEYPIPAYYRDKLLWTERLNQIELIDSFTRLRPDAIHAFVVRELVHFLETFSDKMGTVAL